MSFQHEHTDQDLVRRIAQGEEEAFNELFYRYVPKLQSFLLGMVKNEEIANELVQDVFLKVWQKQEELAEIKSISAWLYRVASNAAITQLRRFQVEKRVHLKTAVSDTETGDVLIEALQARELERMIRQAIEKLPEQRRRIFTLSNMHGLSYAEIAERLDISENTVRNQVAIARKAVQHYIQQHGGEYIPWVLILAALAS